MEPNRPITKENLHFLEFLQYFPSMREYYSKNLDLIVESDTPLKYVNILKRNANSLMEGGYIRVGGELDHLVNGLYRTVKNGRK